MRVDVARNILSPAQILNRRNVALKTQMSASLSVEHRTALQLEGTGIVILVLATGVAIPPDP